MTQTLPTLEQVARAKSALRLAHEDFVVAVHIGGGRFIESGIVEFKAAAEALGFELVQRVSPGAAGGRL